MAKHARLSASAAHRWMNCAGSVGLIGDESSETNEEAMRGTAAHRVIEMMLDNGWTDASEFKNYKVHVHEGDEDAKLLAFDKLGPPKGWHEFIVDDDMVYGVQMMIDEVERVRAEIGASNCALYTERYLDMSWLDPRLGGTADVTLIENFGMIHLFDYKNGRIVVEVKGNEQMKNYAVGLLHEHPEGEGVHVHLVQPNAPHEDGQIRDESYTCDELKVFELRMKEAADATGSPNAEFRVGDWCEWCVAKTRCKTFEREMQEIAEFEFADDEYDKPLKKPDMGDIDELVRKSKFIPLFDRWCKDILAAIESALLSGVEVPGKKLVRTRSHRKWPSHDHKFAKQIAEEAEINIASLWAEPELKSPAQIEKLGAGKEHKALVKEIVAKYAIKPEGALVVADADDERPAVDLIAEGASEFADDEEDIMS